MALRNGLLRGRSLSSACNRFVQCALRAEPRALPPWRFSTPYSNRNMSTSTSTLTEASPPVLSNVDEFSNSAADYLQAFHEAIPFDSSWSLTIPLISLFVRGISLPLLYHNQLHRGRATIAAKEEPRIQYFVRNSPGTLVQKYYTYRRLHRIALRSAGTSSWLQLPWHLTVHLPLIISASLGMRELSARASNGWSGTSLAWLADLGAPDPTSALPVLTTALWLWNLEPGGVPPQKLHPVQRLPITAGRFILRSLQVLSVVSLSVTTQLPSGLVLFWAGNAILTTTLRTALGSDTIRRRIGLLTEADLKEISVPPVIQATGQAFEEMRKELATIQTELLSRFQGRAVDESLVNEVNRMLRRERMSGRTIADLKAVIRIDEQDGKKYLAVVPSGT